MILETVDADKQELVDQAPPVKESVPSCYLLAEGYERCDTICQPVEEMQQILWLSDMGCGWQITIHWMLLAWGGYFIWNNIKRVGSVGLMWWLMMFMVTKEEKIRVCTDSPPVSCLWSLFLPFNEILSHKWNLRILTLQLMWTNLIICICVAGSHQWCCPASQFKTEAEKQECCGCQANKRVIAM